MKFAKLIAFLALFALPWVTGCGGKGSGTGPVVEQDEIAAYVAENPDSDAGTDVEGGDP